MFLENTVNQKEQFGWIKVICGSMFSGKTEELIRRLKRAKFARQKVEIFKPAIDTRYDDDMVISHDSNEIRSTPVPAAANIPILADDCDVVRTQGGHGARLLVLRRFIRVRDLRGWNRSLLGALACTRVSEPGVGKFAGGRDVVIGA